MKIKDFLAMIIVVICGLLITILTAGIAVLSFIITLVTKDENHEDNHRR